MRVSGADPFLPVGARLSCTNYADLYGGGLQVNPLSCICGVDLARDNYCRSRIHCY